MSTKLPIEEWSGTEGGTWYFNPDSENTTLTFRSDDTSESTYNVFCAFFGSRKWGSPFKCSRESLEKFKKDLEKSYPVLSLQFDKKGNMVFETTAKALEELRDMSTMHRNKPEPGCVLKFGEGESTTNCHCKPYETYEVRRGQVGDRTEKKTVQQQIGDGTENPPVQPQDGGGTKKTVQNAWFPPPPVNQQKPASDGETAILNQQLADLKEEPSAPKDVPSDLQQQVAALTLKFTSCQMELAAEKEEADASKQQLAATKNELSALKKQYHKLWEMLKLD